MSKNLVKIISICAMAILLLLTIVGVALCVTEPVFCTLKVEEGGLTGQYASSNLTIRVEGEDQEGTSIKVKKNSEVSVVFSGTGYDFEGWFKGKADEIKENAEAVSFDTAYQFTIRGNTTLTAMRDVIKYTVNYSGYLDDGQTSVSEQISEVQQTVEYGANLETLVSSQGGTHEGWYIASDSEAVDGQVYKTATFAQRTVNLKAKWSNLMLITYKVGDKVIATNGVNESNASSYNLLDATDDVVKNNITAGYKFAGWVDGSNNAVTSITFDQNGITLYLKETLITYTLNVKYNAVSEENASTITYDAKNGFSAYSLKDSRACYTFKGFEYDGSTYLISDADYLAGSNKLSDIIKAQSATSLNVTAIWECEYSSFDFNLKGFSHYQRDGYTYATDWGVFGTKGTQNDQLIEMFDMSVNFEDKAGNYYYDLSDNAYELLFGEYSNLHIKEGDAVSFNGVIKITGEENGVTYEVSGLSIAELTFHKIITSLEYRLGSLDNITEITVGFMFDKVA